MYYATSYQLPAAGSLLRYLSAPREGEKICGPEAGSRQLVLSQSFTTRKVYLIKR